MTLRGPHAIASRQGHAKEKPASQSKRQDQSALIARPWASYETWDALRADHAAAAAYLAERDEAVANPGYDWSRVLAEVVPKLSEAREYIGVASVDPDVPGGRTLYVV